MTSDETPAGPMVNVTGLTKRFGDTQVLTDVDLSVEQGEVVAIIGPSGSGKSTLLRCINLIEPPTAGRIELDGQPIFDGQRKVSRGEAHRRRTALLRMGMVFQQFNLFPHLTALDNVIEAPVSVLRRAKQDVTREATELFERVGLADKLNVRPGSLSGGQQQRVAIVRALLMHPQVMLFDEPTSALDPEMVGEVLGVIRKVVEDNMTVLIVTHEMQFAKSVADRVVILDKGRIIESGPPAEVLVSPRDERSREFLHRVLHPEAQDVS